MTTNVEARDFGDGTGGGPSRPGVGGTWLNEEDPGRQNPRAFSRFLTVQRNSQSYRTRTWMVNWINNSGQGARLPDGSRESLAATCERSEYIWWYGAGPSDRELTGHFYTQARNTHNLPPSNWQTMSSRARIVLNMYIAQSSNWSGGRVNLICSAAFVEPEPVEVPITISANSGTFTYNGSRRTVNGHRITAGSLKSGHRITVSSSRSATNVGSYTVPVSSVRMTDSSGRNVTSEYKITTREGTLRINPVASITGDDKRCVTPRTDSASAYVHTRTTGSHGFTPDGVSSLRRIERGEWTAAGNHANNTNLPRIGSSISTWNSWKNTFQNGSSTSTPTIDLEAGGVSGVLSQHGGVYNVLRTLRRDSYTVESCQPQTREKVTRTRTEYTNEVTRNPDGTTTTTRVPHTYSYQEWSSWSNDGARRIENISGPSTTYEYNNYQILSVNCNVDGFNSVRNATGGEVISIGNGDGGAVLKTPTRSGTTTGNLGKTGITRNSAFYTDGDSCAEAFTCTVTPSATASNDAVNNKGNSNLFGEVLEGNEVGETNENGELVFFRDNEDRQVRADVWYPKSTGKADLNAHSGQPAKETFVKIYGDEMPGHSDPTPEIELTTIAPWNPASRRNNGMEMIDFAERFSGEVNRFNMKSQWASNEGTPYQVGINWEYEATGRNRIPSRVDGYNVRANRDYSHTFDVYCDFRNDSSEYQANIPETPYAHGRTTPEWSPVNAIRALFSRSASNMN